MELPAVLAALNGLLLCPLGRTRTWTAAELVGYARSAGFGRGESRRPPAVPGNVLLMAGG